MPFKKFKIGARPEIKKRPLDALLQLLPPSCSSFRRRISHRENYFFRATSRNTLVFLSLSKQKSGNISSPLVRCLLVPRFQRSCKIFQSLAEVSTPTQDPIYRSIVMSCMWSALKRSFFTTRYGRSACGTGHLLQPVQNNSCNQRSLLSGNVRRASHHCPLNCLYN